MRDSREEGVPDLSVDDCKRCKNSSSVLSFIGKRRTKESGDCGSEDWTVQSRQEVEERSSIESGGILTIEIAMSQVLW